MNSIKDIENQADFNNFFHDNKPAPSMPALSQSGISSEMLQKIS
jgi:hypothetical protein